MPQTIASALHEAGQALLEVSDSPGADAEILLAHVLEVARSHLRAWPDRPLEAGSLARFHGLIERRRHGEPVAYLTGRREFWSLPLAVTPDVLIPRPETELLVQLSLEHLPAKRAPRIAELGTGSGAIAVALARECRRCRIVATDLAAAALAVARWNAEQLGLTRIEFHLGRWFAPLEGEVFDLVVSNPPYIAAGDPHLEQGDVRFEPRDALVADEDGLAALREIVQASPGHLAPGGWLLLEHGFEQGPRVRSLLEDAGFEAVETRQDLAGHDRVTLGRRPSTPPSAA